MKMTRKDGSVIIAAVARKICGIAADKSVSKMTTEEKRSFWTVSKAFSKRKYFIGDYEVQQFLDK